MAEKVRSIGPYSSTDRLLRIDGRTRLGKFCAELRAALVEHVGGEPTATEQLQIVAIILKMQRIMAMVDKGITGDHDDKELLAWLNGLGRAADRLGFEARSNEVVRSLGDIINQERAA